MMLSRLALETEAAVGIVAPPRMVLRHLLQLIMGRIAHWS